LRTFRAHVEVQGVMQSLDMCAGMVLNRKLREPLHDHDWKDIMADLPISELRKLANSSSLAVQCLGGS